MNDTISYDGYTLVFEDRFDGHCLNRDDWNVELHEPGWVNEELQRYVDSEENIRLRNGCLELRPVKRKGSDGRDAYSSGRINTQGKHEFTYGLFEARLRVPRGKGFLPAFWLMTGDEQTYEPWPVCGEIDIMEILGDRLNTSYGTLHYGLPHTQSQGSFTLEEGDFSQEFHRFSLLWEPGRMSWYIDGKCSHSLTDWFCVGRDGKRRRYPAPFDHPMYLILNLAVGGSWVGNPDETTDFDHAVFAVDDVRVYQKNWEVRHGKN